MPKTKKPEPQPAPESRAIFRDIVKMITDYNREEGLTPSEPLTADTLLHAAAFIDGKPAEPEKAAPKPDAE